MDVAIGASADHVDHHHEATVPAGETSLRVARLGPVAASSHQWDLTRVALVVVAAMLPHPF